MGLRKRDGGCEYHHAKVPRGVNVCPSSPQGRNVMPVTTDRGACYFLPPSYFSGAKTREVPNISARPVSARTLGFGPKADGRMESPIEWPAE